MESAVSPRTIASMPAHARVWVYKSATPFTSEQRQAILERGAVFTAAWAAHGSALDACVDVLHDHFVVIAVDEQRAMASGCGIDKSVRLLQELERDLAVNLTDRMVVLYEGSTGITSCRVPEVEGLIKGGALKAETPVYDDLVNTCGDLQARFRSPLSTTWLARYL